MKQVLLSILAVFALRTIWSLISIMTQDVPKGWLYGITERRIRLIREIKIGIVIVAAIIVCHFVFPDIVEDTGYNLSSTHNSYLNS